MSNSYDLIVVGTGFASTFFLKKYLSKVPAHAKVLVLERGYLYPNSERRKALRGEHTDFAKLNPEHLETFDNKNPEKEWLFTIGFGGSSNCWFACTPRFLPADFRMKTLYGIVQDWPISYDEIEPYYTEAEKLMDISGPEETPYPMSSPYPLPPHSLNTVDKILHGKYGSQYISQPTARASRAVNGRNACCVNSVCSVCPVNAKFTIENSNMNVYEDPRVEVIYGANVIQLDLQNDIVKSVSFLKDGSTHKVSGELFALGANAVFNASILLNSGDTTPLVGKCLGEQYGLDMIVYLDNLNNVGAGTVITANGYMLYDGEHRKDYAACLIESHNHPHLRIEQGKWRHVATFRMIFEDLPQQTNYVAKGADGLKPELHFKPSSYTARGVEKMKEKIPDVLACLPVEKIEYTERFRTEAHILGTTRMSSNKSDGVVDKHLIHHQYRNLFVLGSGAFTTYSPSNPTLTLSALSLFAADKSF